MKLWQHIGPVLTSVPANTQLVGLWLIRRNEGRKRYKTYLPVAIRVRLDQDRIQAKLTGKTAWFPYPELLLKLPGEEQSAMPGAKVQDGIWRLLQ